MAGPSLEPRNKAAGTALVIIPCYNEKESIGATVAAVRAAGDWDYLVVDDGSTDGTTRILEKQALNHVRLASNLGIGGAVQTGFRYAREQGYQTAVQLDGDGQHDPCDIPRLLAELEAGRADLVIGSRFGLTECRRTAYRPTAIRRVGIRYFRLLLRLLTGLRIADPTSGFRAVNRRLIEEFAHFYPVDFPEVEVLVSLRRKGYCVHEVEVTMNERQGGASSIDTLDSLYYMAKVTILALVRRFL